MKGRVVMVGGSRAGRSTLLAEAMAALKASQPILVSVDFTDGDVRVAQAHDRHADNAARMFKVPVSEVTKAQRRYAKLQAHAAAYSQHALNPTEYVGEIRCADRLLNATHRVPAWMP